MIEIETKRDRDRNRDREIETETEIEIEIETEIETFLKLVEEERIGNELVEELHWNNASKTVIKETRQ